MIILRLAVSVVAWVVVRLVRNQCLRPELERVLPMRLRLLARVFSYLPHSQAMPETPR